MAKINDEDMELIMKADREDVIQKMLNDRLYCLIKLPKIKPDNIIGDISSTIFVSNMNGYLVTSLAIRDIGSKSLYEECEYYLCIYFKRGFEEKEIFQTQPCSKIQSIGEFSYPTVDELIGFLKGKELVALENYMSYGNREALKTKMFLKEALLIWENRENEFVIREEQCEVRIYLTGIDGECSDVSNHLIPIDVRKLKLEQTILRILREKSHNNFPEDYYSVEYETCSETVQAVNFTTRFHSNTAWEADPINYVYVRISAFVLPGKASVDEYENAPKKQITSDIDGNKYMIDSIHFNSDIFDDISEFGEFMDMYFYYFGYD